MLRAFHPLPHAVLVLYSQKPVYGLFIANLFICIQLIMSVITCLRHLLSSIWSWGLLLSHKWVNVVVARHCLSLPSLRRISDWYICIWMRRLAEIIITGASLFPHIFSFIQKYKSDDEDKDLPFFFFILRTPFFCNKKFNLFVNMKC